MSHTNFYPASTRFITDRGWVKGKHYFNFGPYFDANRTAFGPLLILNDDTVIKGAGFSEHPHANMEIISLPLSGSIRHKDNTGMEATIHTGDIQIMSAGTGIRHSETNPSHNEDLRFLQIWIMPNIPDVLPRYQQITMNNQQNTFNMVVSPEAGTESLFIQQHAWLYLGTFDPMVSTIFKPQKNDNGLYILIIDGEVTIDGQELNTGDTLSISGSSGINVAVEKQSRILIIEVSL